MIKSVTSIEFLRFIVTGGIAALVNLVSRYLLDFVMPYSAAIVLAYLLGMAVAFTLFRIFVFGPSERSARSQFIRFVLVNLVAVIQVWAISVVLAHSVFPAVGMTWHPFDVAHVIGVIVPVFSSYIGHKHFSFSNAR